jgi:hypothetical protein
MSLLVKPITGLLGLALTIIGIAGFFASGGLLFGFEVDTMQNIVHLVAGLIGLFAFNSSQVYSRWFLILAGLVFAVIAIVGFTMGGDIFGLFHVNAMGNYLHLVVAAVALIIGFGSGK